MDERRQAPWAERVLVERLSGGDETALAELYDRYAPFVYGLAVRTLVDRQIAEEVTQEVFVSLWEHPKQIEPDADLARLPRHAHPPPCRRRRAQRGGAGAGRSALHGTRTRCPTLPTWCSGRTRPAGSATPSRCSPTPSARRSSWRTLTDIRTGRSPRCWASRRAPQSRGYA